MSDWKGGVKPTGLAKGNDGFTNVPDRKPSFGGVENGSQQVSREDTGVTTSNANNK